MTNRKRNNNFFKFALLVHNKHFMQPLALSVIEQQLYVLNRWNINAILMQLYVKHDVSDCSSQNKNILKEFWIPVKLKTFFLVKN